MTNEEELDTKIGKRFLVIEIDDETREVEWDETGFAAWEIAGIATALMASAEETLSEGEEDE